MRYYFNLTNGEDEIHDEEGIELPGYHAALISALEAIRELKAENLSQADDWRGWILEIADHSGDVMEIISLETSPKPGPLEQANWRLGVPDLKPESRPEPRLPVVPLH